MAVLFTGGDRHPALLAARADFPETPHQNMMPEGLPRYPCVDDRPWDDAAPGWSPYAYVERVKWWLNAAAMGELTGTGQVVDSLFVPPGPDLLVPARILSGVEAEASFSLVPPPGLADGDIRCLHLVEGSGMPSGQGGFKAILLVAPVSMARSVAMPPSNVEALLRVAQAAGLDLLRSLQNWIARLPAADLPRRGALLLNFPVHAPGSAEARTGLVAFALACNLGQLGTMLGVLGPEPERTLSWGKLVTHAPVQLDLLAAEPMLSMAVQLEFDLAAARPFSGTPDGCPTRALLVGAGAIGSHVALALTREGRHSWTLADGDWLRPHNLARHVLGQSQVGQPKARALAMLLSDLSRAPATPIVCDVLRPGDQAQALEEGASGADVILDASASVAVSRRISDWGHSRARRVSAFFNPSGDAAVLLVEDAARAIRLDALEAQYYRLVLRDGTLSAHLAPPPEGFRYAGSCRAVSARILESRVSLLSGLAAGGIGAALSGEGADIRVWSCQPDGSIAIARTEAFPGRRETLAGWTVLLDDGLAADIRRRREAALPSETGGVLVGTVDMQRRVVAVVDALGPPADSSGRPGGVHPWNGRASRPVGSGRSADQRNGEVHRGMAQPSSRQPSYAEHARYTPAPRPPGRAAARGPACDDVDLWIRRGTGRGAFRCKLTATALVGRPMGSQAAIRPGSASAYPAAGPALWPSISDACARWTRPACWQRRASFRPCRAGASSEGCMPCTTATSPLSKPGSGRSFAPVSPSLR